MERNTEHIMRENFTMRMLTNQLFITCILFSGYTFLSGMALTEDAWVHIFNLVSMKDQIILGSTCKRLKNLFDTRAYTDVCNISLGKPLLKKIYAECKQLFAVKAQKNNDSLASLCMKTYNNQIGGSITFNTVDDALLPTLFSHFVYNQSITALDFTNCKLKNTAASFLATALAQRTISLKKLAIAGNALGYSTIYELVKASSALEELDCTETGIIVLKDCARKNHSLEINTGTLTPFVHQPPCSIQLVLNDHFLQLAQNLMHLKKLSLCNCRLTWHRSTWLIDFLKNNTCLTTLILQKNHFTNDSQKHLELRKAADTPTHALIMLDISLQFKNIFNADVIPYQPTRTSLQILL